MTSAVLAVLALVIVIIAVGLVRLRGRGLRGDVGLALVPVAEAPWGRVRVEVTNTGTVPIEGLRVGVLPAPPAVAPDALPHVVATADVAHAAAAGPLAPGASTALELACPLRPGPLYRRVLGLDPDDDEPVYGLPIETLLGIDVRWRERRWPWSRGGGRALVRGRYRDGPLTPRCRLRRRA